MRGRQGAEAQGDTGLGVGRCGKIGKSLQDFRQGSDEMESSFLKDQIGFYTENSFGRGEGGRVEAGRPGRRPLQGPRRQYSLNVRCHVFSKSSNNAPGSDMKHKD